MVDVLGFNLLCSWFWLICVLSVVVWFLWLNVFIFFILIVLLMVLVFILDVIDLDIFSVWISFDGIIFSVIECILVFGDGIFRLLMVMLFRFGLILWMLIKWFLFWLCFIERFGKCCSDFVVFWFGNWLMVLVDIIDLMLLVICCWLIVFVWLLCCLCIMIFFNVLFLVFSVIIGVMFLLVMRDIVWLMGLVFR